jgi:N-acetylglucosamine-6-phosphate deacetylase
MASAQIIARHYATGSPLRVQWHDGRISALDPAENAPENLWVAPALIDLQVNGYGGVDFQQTSIKADDLISAVTALHASACSQILLTLITQPWTDLMAQLRRVRQLREQNPLLKSAIAGWHIEGPFLSPEPGFHGAHNPGVMLDPTPEHIQELRKVTQDDPVLLTLAAERENALPCIKLATSLGIRISLGHTNANAEQVRQAVANGATGFTHLGNGIPQTLDRHDNILWRVFDVPGLTAGVIPDKIHVAPMLFRTIHRQLPKNNIYYTTDAMSAAGAPPGEYTIGDVKLAVGEDQIVRQPGRTNFAGSALRPMDAIRRASEMLSCSWRDVWDHYSTVPAHLMGLDCRVRANCTANLCVLETNAAGSIIGGQTFVDGTAHDLKV